MCVKEFIAAFKFQNISQSLVALLAIRQMTDILIINISTQWVNLHYFLFQIIILTSNMILLEITLGCTSDSLSVYDGLDGEDIERRIVELCGEHENIKVRYISFYLIFGSEFINNGYYFIHHYYYIHH